ncbi:MAG: SGNH/GDSL hydrolase family protein [Vicinamibacterales bacterium]
MAWSLWAAGAREFFVVNLPNFALTPAVRQGPAAQGAAAQFTAAFNGGLNQVLISLGALPGIHVRRLDSNAVLTSIVADPSAAGLTDVEDACLTFGVVRNPFCHLPNDCLFRDGIHPTKAGHVLLAAAAKDVLTAP